MVCCLSLSAKSWSLFQIGQILIVAFDQINI